ncbi:MAG: branched-chain amino acid transaminase [Leptolyngbyaceae cyanobacterium bins.59]|nr:branched-chain amino acid transaminase [Leptolyngbyaceae cyanobacterium bins.59]
MDSFLPIAYFQNEFIPFVDAKLSIATHALHYGTAAIGGLRGLPDPQNPGQVLLFRLERHCQRLSQSARFLHHDISAATIKTAIVEFLKRNKPDRPFYIRPLIYTSGLGIAPRLHQVEKSLLIYGIALDDYLPATGVSCRISSWRRQTDDNLPLRGKHSAAYLTSALAKTEAVDSGFDEAIMLNAQGKVSEASGMNIFMVRNGTLITPGVEQDILEGITRDSVITLARDLGISVVERPVDRTELLIAEEVFLTGTAARISPVNRIESSILPTDRPITERLRTHLTAITEGRDEQYRGWVDVISVKS